MNRVARIVIALLALAGGWGGGDAGLRAATFTIATYNVENYTAASRLISAGYRKDYPKPEEAKRALRAVIHGLNADVLILQEMGPPAYFEELRRDLKNEGLDYPHALLVRGPDKDRHVALLSKRPALRLNAHADLSFKYLGTTEKVKRGLLEACWQVGRHEVTIYGLHLKSRFTDRPDDPESGFRRGGEATAIRDFILERHTRPEEEHFLIVGDFNDTKSSRAVRFLSVRGKTPIARLLPAADSRGESWTYYYRKEDRYERVDHILASAAVISAVREGRAWVYDGDGVLKASDHRPVSVTIDLPEQ